MKAVHFDRDGDGLSPRCGNGAWAHLTAVETDVNCRKCISLMEGTWAVGRRWCDVKPCGEPAAYRRHLRRGEPVHEECRRAANRDAADRKARRQRKRKALAA